MSDCEHDKRFKSVFFLPKKDRGCLACGFERVSAENERLESIKAAADYLYWQLHNIKTVTPRWANENVCEAMRNLGEALKDD